MRKNINKLVAFAIGISVMSGSVIPAFADDTNKSTNVATSQSANTTVNQSATTTANQNVNSNNYIYVSNQTIQKPLLTLKDSIDAAISTSETLNLDDIKISYQGKINDVNEEKDDANKVDDDKQDLDSDTNENTLRKLKQQKDFDTDILTQKVTTAYNSLVTNQMKIDKAAKVIELKNKDLSDSNLKKSLGLATSIDVQTTQLQIQNLQITQKQSINALKDAQYSFKALTGKDASQYSLEQDIKFEPFKVDGSIDEYLDKVIDKYQKYDEQLLKINKDYYSDSDHKITDEDVEDAKKTLDSTPQPSSKPTDPSDADANAKYNSELLAYNDAANKYSQALNNRLGYLNGKLGVYSQQTSIDEAKKNYKNSLKSLYTQLLYTEDNINYIKNNIQLNNEQLKNAKLKYDLGMITKSDYDNQVTSTQDLDIQLRTTVDSYNTLKNQIQKPWTMGSGTGAASGAASAGR